MLYICIPAYNEAPTIGVLLWKIRKVFQEYSREYEVLVFDDGSADETRETLAPYAKVLPLSVIGGDSHLGYAGALTSLIRAASHKTRYARRDAVITLQGDFTDQPEFLPELVKRFEGGADIVVAESREMAEAPKPVRRLRRLAPWMLRPFIKTPGVDDPFGSFRLYRVSTIRDALKAAGESPLVSGEGWAANVDLLLKLTPHARRVETLTIAQRYDLRPRESRVKPFADALSLFRFGRAASRRPALVTAGPAPQPS